MYKTQDSSKQARNERKRAAVRNASRAARAGLSAAERELASKNIADAVVRSSWFRRSRFIACYLPMPEEVDTWMLIGRAWRMKKRIFAPIIEKNFTMRFREITAESELAVNWYGLAEPTHGQFISPRKLDLVITPVVAFDAKCNRIGMGGGYFDRAFAFLRHRKYLLRPKLVGVAFTCQRVEKIAPNPWDIRLFRVVDETT